MATILKPGPTTNGCSNCLFNADNSIPGHVVIVALDDQGVYTFIGRCYYCNHRDRILDRAIRADEKEEESLTFEDVL